MKGISPAGVLLIGLTLSQSLSANDSIPKNWKIQFHRPEYTVSFANGMVTTHGQYSRLWHKIVYKTPQESTHGKYTSEIVQVEMDCSNRTVAVVREVRYTANGSLLSDTVTPDKHLVRVSDYSKNPVDIKGDAVQRIGLDDEDIVCRTGD